MFPNLTFQQYVEGTGITHLKNCTQIYIRTSNFNQKVANRQQHFPIPMPIIYVYSAQKLNFLQQLKPWQFTKVANELISTVAPRSGTLNYISIKIAKLSFYFPH
jgi:hypothetical protein